MPDYTKRFAAAGGAVGAAGGGIFSQALGALSNPREALWNLPGKLMEGDFGAAAPGLLGLGAAGIAGAMGGGLPLALLAGAGVGGVGQAIGKGMDEERFHAPTGGDLVEALGGDRESTLGQIGGMGAEMALDPLTYAGMGGGGKAGAKYGGYLGDLANARGPQYPGGAEKLTSLLSSEIRSPSGKTPNMPARIQEILNGPYRDRILGEIQPGAQGLGQGEEAFALRNGPDSVLRIAGGPGALDVPTRLRGRTTAPNPTPNIPEMLQPGRDVAIGPYRVSHTPLADVLPSEMRKNPFHPMFQELERASPHLDAGIEARGWDPVDTHLSNLGRIGEDRYAVIDPGSVRPPPGFEHPEGVRDRRGDPISNAILNLLGADSSVQREIEQRLAQSRATSGLHLPDIAPDVAHGQSLLPGQLRAVEEQRQRALEQVVDAHAGLMHGPPLHKAQQKLAGLEEAGGQMRQVLGLPQPGTGPDIQELVRRRIQQMNAGTNVG